MPYADGTLIQMSDKRYVEEKHTEQKVCEVGGRDGSHVATK